MAQYKTAFALMGVFALGACAVAPPSGPSAMALPGNGKSFEAFQQDESVCRQYASVQSGGNAAAEAGTESAVGSAAIGTVVGAAAGAALGAAAGNAGLGAAAGAGAGLLTGGAIGSNGAAISSAELQRRYDMSYTQCMYGHGNSVTAAAQPAPSYPAAYPAPGYYYAPAPTPYPYGYYGYYGYGRRHW